MKLFGCMKKGLTKVYTYKRSIGFYIYEKAALEERKGDIMRFRVRFNEYMLIFLYLGLLL